MDQLTLDDPHHVTATYLGEPGDRTFYVQAEDAHQRITLLVEKGHVGGIAELLIQLLSRVDDVPATDWDRQAMQLREPVEPRWRVGEIGGGLDPQLGRFVLEFTELVLDDEEGEVVRFSMDQDQARRLAAHAAEVVGEGRPTCQLCGRPTEPDGSHVCPATNGHGRLSR